MGAIGLFLGAIVLSIGYKLFLVWLEQAVPVRPVMPERSASAGIGL